MNGVKSSGNNRYPRSIYAGRGGFPFAVVKNSHWLRTEIELINLARVRVARSNHNRSSKCCWIFFTHTPQNGQTRRHVSRVSHVTSGLASAYLTGPCGSAQARLGTRHTPHVLELYLSQGSRVLIGGIRVLSNPSDLIGKISWH